VENMMKNQSSLRAHKYDVCVNGCKLYNLNDNDSSCRHCFSQRLDNTNKPISTIKIMSIGDILSRLISNPITRQELHYRHHYDNREIGDSGVIGDVFDGEEYKLMKSNHAFICEDDIAISLFNDGFVVDKRGSRLFTIIHVIVNNYDPRCRFQEPYTIQLAILPGKKKPVSFDSYLSVILAEIKHLSTFGMVIKTSDGQIIRSKVHCLAAGGDTLGISVFIKHLN
jgi:hypothetical protein